MSKYYKAEDMENLITNIAPDGEVFELGMDALKHLPTIEVEEGAWITARNSYEIICSNCECEAFSEYGEYVKTNFCPDCGARMKG